MEHDHHNPIPGRHPTESRTYRRLRWELWLIFMLIVVGLLYLRYGNEIFELRLEEDVGALVPHFLSVLPAIEGQFTAACMITDLQPGDVPAAMPAQA